MLTRTAHVYTSLVTETSFSHFPVHCGQAGSLFKHGLKVHHFVAALAHGAWRERWVGSAVFGAADFAFNALQPVHLRVVGRVVVLQCGLLASASGAGKKHGLAQRHFVCVCACLERVGAISSAGTEEVA
jgi:hypothetical protein